MAIKITPAAPEVGFQLDSKGRPTKVVLIAPPLGFVRPRWDGTKWIEYVPWHKRLVNWLAAGIR